MSSRARFLVPVLIATLLGPLVAGLMVWLVSAVFIVASSTEGTSFIAGLPSMLLLTIIFAYGFGGPIGFIAGLLVSIWSLRRRPNLPVVVGAAILSTACCLAIAALGMGGLRDVQASALLVFPLAIAAAVVCWLLMRRYVERLA